MRKLIEGLTELEDYKEAAKLRLLLASWDIRQTDVHTEHCCLDCKRCKYRDENCTVLTGKLKQSYACEDCVKRDKQEKFIDSFIDSVATFVTFNSDSYYDNSKELSDAEDRMNKLKKEFMDNYSCFED